MLQPTHNFTADGNKQFTIRGGGRGAEQLDLYAWGDFGGGTLTMEASPDGGTTWIAVADIFDDAVSVGAAAIVHVRLNPILARVVLTGATDPDLNVATF